LSLIALFFVLALPSFRLAFGFELPNLWSSLATSLNLIAIAFVLKWLN
jgi:ABC-type iron transport system FetAB permease component